MITIRLLDARRGLYRKCEELFGNAKIAEAIYRFLCDGIEECEDVDPERKKGKWIICTEGIEETFHTGCRCSVCNYWKPMGIWNYCPNCGAEMKGEGE